MQWSTANKRLSKTVPTEHQPRKKKTKNRFNCGGDQRPLDELVSHFRKNLCNHILLPTDLVAVKKNPPSKKPGGFAKNFNNEHYLLTEIPISIDPVVLAEAVMSTFLPKLSAVNAVAKA